METTTPTSGKIIVHRIPQNNHFLTRSAFTIGSLSANVCVDAIAPLLYGRPIGRVRAESDWPLLLGNLEIDFDSPARRYRYFLVPGQRIGEDRSIHGLVRIHVDR